MLSHRLTTLFLISKFGTTVPSQVADAVLSLRIAKGNAAAPIPQHLQGAESESIDTVLEQIQAARQRLQERFQDLSDGTSFDQFRS